MPPPYGGVTVYVDRLILRLRKEGMKVGAYYSADSAEAEVEQSPMMDLWEWMSTTKFPVKIWKYLRECRPYQIVHSHFSLEGMIYLWAIKNIGRKKVVVTIHNSMVGNFWRSTNFINRYFLRKMLASPDVKWITVSQQGKEQLLQLPTDVPREIHVVPPYIPQTDEPYTPLKPEMQKYIDDHDKIIVFYGHSFMENSGEDIYGFTDAIKMYAAIVGKLKKKVGLVLCISLSDDIDKLGSLHRLAADADVDDKIFWQEGAISNMRTLWHEADIYVRPTSTDGDSVAVREALDEGITVIASDVCPRPERTITYRYGDTADFADKVASHLSTTSQPTSPNFEPYYQMKKIYEEMLHD